MASEAVTLAELEAALEALREPGRFDAAERLVGLAAPGLHRILVEAMAGGGWNSEDDAREIDKALGAADPAAAKAAVLGLLGESSRVAMLVGVAVGIELAAELDLHGQGEPPLTITRHQGTEGSS
ncbi:MAG: hypothetical protein Q7T55_23845 [Solirubrobacteraceae bacterium]|nr:hypothetical protein [Solirubrobacteraceae bacterium]